MTCIEVQGLITPFINNQLDDKKLYEFISHINNCYDCKEELEVYYTLLTGMKQLDEDKNLSDNFHLELMNKIKKSEEYLKRRKLGILRKQMILISIILIVGLFSSISIGEYVISNENTIEEYVPLHYNFYKDQYKTNNNKHSIYKSIVDQIIFEHVTSNEEMLNEEILNEEILENRKLEKETLGIK